MQTPVSSSATNHYINNRNHYNPWSNHFSSFKMCLWLATTSYSVYVDSKTVACVAALLSIEKSMWYFTKMHNLEEEISPERWKRSKEMKWKMLKVKFESNVNLFIEEIADCRNVGTATVPETLDVQPKELLKMVVSTYVEKVVVMNKVKMSQRKWWHKNTSL